MNKEEALKKIAEEDGFFKHNNYEIHMVWLMEDLYLD